MLHPPFPGGIAGMSPPGAKPSPHPTSSILSSAAPAPHFHREKPGGRGRQRWENLHREETNSFPVFFFFPAVAKRDHVARRTDGQTDIRPSVPSRAPSRGSRAGSLARCGSSLQLSLKRICGRRTLLPQQNQENNFRIKPSGTIKNEKKNKKKNHQHNSKPQP